MFDGALSTLMSMSILTGGFVLLYFAYRSNSDGKALIKKSIEKRNLFAEIILLIMAIIEGVNAATYAVKEGRDFGASIAMHVLGGVMSGIFAFGIYKQVTDVALALKKNKHPLIITKEVVDVLGTIILAVIFPIVNTYFVAIAAKHPHDFWNTIQFNWSRIVSGSVYYSTVIGMAHVFACFLLSLNSFDVSVLEDNPTDDDEAVEVPLTLASDSTIEEDADTDEEEESTSAPLITNEVVPYSRIPDRANLINYIQSHLQHIQRHLGHQVDIDRVKHRMMVDESFLNKVALSIEDGLRKRDVWDEYKRELREVSQEKEAKKRQLAQAQRSYNYDPQSRIASGLISEIGSLETKMRKLDILADNAEDEYNKELDNLSNTLSIL